MSDEQYQSLNAQMVAEIASGKRNPLHTLEAISEHVGMIHSWCLKNGIPAPIVVNGKLTAQGKVGDIDYELVVISEYLHQVFSEVAVLEPELYEASKGDEQALNKLSLRLKALAMWHESKFKKFLVGADK